MHKKKTASLPAVSTVPVFSRFLCSQQSSLLEDQALKFLKKKWEELVSLANENVMYFLSEDSLLELIKFLISNLEHRCYAVNVFSKSDCYFLCDLQGKRIDDFMLEKQGIYEDGNLLTILVALNPEKIIVHCNKFVKDKLLRNLFSLFPNRIEICK